MSTCKCGNCPPARLARGLTPFCQMTPVATQAAGHATYAGAVAANPGRRVRLISGGLGTGAPARFGVRS